MIRVHLSDGTVRDFDANFAQVGADSSLVIQRIGVMNAYGGNVKFVHGFRGGEPRLWEEVEEVDSVSEAIDGRSIPALVPR